MCNYVFLWGADNMQLDRHNHFESRFDTTSCFSDTFTWIFKSFLHNTRFTTSPLCPGPVHVSGSVAVMVVSMCWVSWHHPDVWKIPRMAKVGQIYDKSVGFQWTGWQF